MSPITQLRVWWATHQAMNQVYRQTVPGYWGANRHGVTVREAKDHPLMRLVINRIRDEAHIRFRTRIAHEGKPGARQWKVDVTDTIKTVIRDRARLAITLGQIPDNRVTKTFTDEQCDGTVQTESVLWMPNFSGVVAADLIHWDDRSSSAHTQAIAAYQQAVAYAGDAAKRV